MKIKPLTAEDLTEPTVPRRYYEEKIGEAKEIACKRGRKDVVDWFMSHGYSGGSIKYLDGVKARFDPDWDELQAQLKEWGIG